MSNLQYPWEREMEDQFERNGCDPGDFNFYLEIWQASNDPYTGGDFDLAGQDGPTTLYSICEYIETWLDQGAWIGDDALPDRWRNEVAVHYVQCQLWWVRALIQLNVSKPKLKRHVSC